MDQVEWQWTYFRRDEAGINTLMDRINKELNTA
jgi:hypothetical protein